MSSRVAGITGDISGRPIAVVGAGTLGRRIGLMFASQGGVVRLYDTSANQQEAAVAYINDELPRLLPEIPDASPADLATPRDLGDALEGAWLVIESLPERIEVKRQIFGELDRLAPADAILATNSSSFPSSQMIDAVTRPDRVVNLHFSMPPERRAVELMSCGRTDDRVIEVLRRRLPSYGLVPFVARAESVGFIHNRVWAAIKREALSVVAEGVATPEEVDELFRMNFQTAVGPFRRMDATGLDVVLAIEEHYAAVRVGIPEGPRELLRQYLAKGWLGTKSGRGFYADYK